uniref:Putative secreted protein n=1 Tax=Anopheles marajoara TaxID=58244 RepID=A0A2M4CCG1_9DIPT
MNSSALAMKAFVLQLLVSIIDTHTHTNKHTHIHTLKDSERTGSAKREARESSTRKRAERERLKILLRDRPPTTYRR